VALKGSNVLLQQETFDVKYIGQKGSTKRIDKMQKSGVKTLSIIDTLSELAHDETEASRLALPSPISVQRGSGNRLSSKLPSIS